MSMSNNSRQVIRDKLFYEMLGTAKSEDSSERKAFVLISSPIAKELVDDIEMDSSVVSRICTLEEMNLEFFPIDSQGFITDNERPLKELYGDKKAFRHLIRKKLAAGVWNSLNKYKSTLPDFPQTETCELLIVDRSVDRIAPIMHDLTYDSMCHELLNMHENKYVHEVPGKAGGPPEKEDDLLKDHDPIWLRRRITLSQRIKQHKCVKIAKKLTQIARKLELTEIGQLEQKLIFGDAEAAELIKFLKILGIVEQPVPVDSWQVITRDGMRLIKLVDAKVTKLVSEFPTFVKKSIKTALTPHSVALKSVREEQRSIILQLQSVEL
ncbi:hypothetical protein K7X08_013215 [Anisodus acutangulus]|uniref:Uncharacterized protein n=1 Tax=Anisodus acutangulus TaxID=402998 RepID=A0A9Q1MB47_9SOLA|nr:hypothetical protein K7X08_013215 [Anisodus acutangulus]